MSGDAPDPRRHVWREDLAAASLRGKVASAHFVEGRAMRVTAALAPMRGAPDEARAYVSEALYGERVEIYEQKDGWAWGQLAGDGYVGYLRLADLGGEGPVPAHRIAALRSYLYPAADIKTPPRALLSLNSPVAVEAVEGDFAQVFGGGGFVVAADLMPLGEWERDFVAVAERFLGTPYLWGGRSSLGLDCSALVQMALAAAGVACPRDSDMQAAELGAPRDPARLEDVRRGDLLFWRGHVAIACSESELIHANAHHMRVEREPLHEAVARIAASGLKVTAIRRIGG